MRRKVRVERRSGGKKGRAVNFVPGNLICFTGKDEMTINEDDHDIASSSIYIYICIYRLRESNLI